ncbi:hypothetical protein R3P38DRAFT_3594166, partial [Favolaschia claudopus]
MIKVCPTIGLAYIRPPSSSAALSIIPLSSFSSVRAALCLQLFPFCLPFTMHLHCALAPPSTEPPCHDKDRICTPSHLSSSSFTSRSVHRHPSRRDSAGTYTYIHTYCSPPFHYRPSTILTSTYSILRFAYDTHSIASTRPVPSPLGPCHDPLPVMIRPWVYISLACHAYSPISASPPRLLLFLYLAFALAPRVTHPPLPRPRSLDVRHAGSRRLSFLPPSLTCHSFSPSFPPLLRYLVIPRYDSLSL